MSPPVTVQTASQFMRHAKRKRLMVEDIDKALKWSRVEVRTYRTSDSSPAWLGPYIVTDHTLAKAKG